MFTIEESKRGRDFPQVVREERLWKTKDAIVESEPRSHDCRNDRFQIPGDSNEVSFTKVKRKDSLVLGLHSYFTVVARQPGARLLACWLVEACQVERIRRFPKDQQR